MKKFCICTLLVFSALICFTQKDTSKKLINITPVITNNPVTGILKPPSLSGWVDMHTHPAAQWGFGEQIFFGDNDGDPALALGSCGCMHNFVVPPFDGSCGLQNMYRNSLVDKIDQENNINPAHSKVAGFPHFDQ